MHKRFFLFFCLIISCNTDVTFYEQERYDGFFVIPLIDPYRLYSSTGRDAPWLVFLKNKIVESGGSNLTLDQIPVSKINVSNGVIFGFDEFRGNESYFFVLIPKKNIEKLFKQKDDWVSFLQTKNIVLDTFYKPDMLYEDFKDNHHSLPWSGYIGTSKMD